MLSCLQLQHSKHTKQIIVDIDKLSHSTTLCNIIIQSLNLKDLCKYNHTHKAYFFEHSDKSVNCSHILIFLRQSAFYTVKSWLHTLVFFKTICMLYSTPDNHQWYRINTNEITDNHNIAICNDITVNMVPLPSAEPLEFNAFKTIASLPFSQNKETYLTTSRHKPFPIPQFQLTSSYAVHIKIT